MTQELCSGAGESARGPAPRPEGMRKLTFVDVQGDGSHSNSNHALRVIEELDGFCVQGKVVGMLKQKVDPKVTNHKTGLLLNISEICQTVIKEKK